MNPSIKTLLVLLALLLPTLLLGLGERPVYKIQEVRIAETAREMLVSGDWVVPRYNGELRLQKPPLPYWLTALSYEAGGVNATAARVPAVVFAVLASLLVFFWSRREAGAKVAANTVLVMAASYIGIRYFRSGEADAPLLFFVSASCLLGYDLLYRGGDALRRALFGLLLGLGFFTKGPAGLAIPLLTLLVLAIVDKRAGRLQPSFKQVFSLPGLALLLVAAFGWYAWIVWQLPDIAQHFVGKQVDETFVSGTHAKPAWWYLAHWVEFFAPWGILLIPAGWLAWRQRGSGTAPAHIRLAWVWLAVVFVLLTLTVNKQMQYALLFLPPLAIILGHYLATAQGRFASANRWLFGLFCVLALVAVGFAARHGGDAGMLLWLALPAVPLALRCALRVEEVSWPVLLVAAATATIYLYSEAYLSKEPRKVAAQTLAAAAAGRAPLYQFQPEGDAQPGDGAVSFYAARVVPPVKQARLPALLQQQAEIWLITSEVPAIAGITAEVVAESDELKLCRLQRTQ